MSADKPPSAAPIGLASTVKALGISQDVFHADKVSPSTKTPSDIPGITHFDSCLTNYKQHLEER
ncbi:hypothetical protein HDU99_005050, partial [Rhizoclosmatium hyalinum]